MPPPRSVILALWLLIQSVSSDDAPNPTFESQKKWLEYYKKKGWLTQPSSGGSDKYTTVPLDMAHLRLDCDADMQPEDYAVPKPYPMCDTLLQKVHAARFDQVQKSGGAYEENRLVWTDATTRWTAYYLSSDPYLQLSSFGDSHGLEFPLDMETVDLWYRLHNDTTCTVQSDSCRRERNCKMSWKWLYPGVTPKTLAPGHSWGESLSVPPHGYEFGKLQQVTRTQVTGRVTIVINAGVAPALDNSDFGIAPQWGMASRGSFGGFDNVPFEWCRICAHTSCETTITKQTSELVAQPVRCKAGNAQAWRPRPWYKPSGATGICGSECPAGSWMTCSTGDVDSCEYPPWLEKEDYQKWAIRVMLLKYGITVPKQKDPKTGLPTYYHPPGDLTQCFPCYLAANQNHYDRSVGAITRDAEGQPDYGDYYCPGGNKPPYSCTLDESNGMKVKAGADMKAPAPGPQACQCLAGYYSFKYEGKVNSDGTPAYKSKNPGDLDCRPCPAGSFCRFRAENTTTEYGSDCPKNQQRCPCPRGHWCRATLGESIGVPEPCDTSACMGDTPARTECTEGYQDKPSYCIPCYRCKQMGGDGWVAPCLNMIDMSNSSYY